MSINTHTYKNIHIVYYIIDYTIIRYLVVSIVVSISTVGNKWIGIVDSRYR